MTLAFLVLCVDFPTRRAGLDINVSWASIYILGSSDWGVGCLQIHLQPPWFQFRLLCSTLRMKFHVTWMRSVWDQHQSVRPASTGTETLGKLQIFTCLVSLLTKCFHIILTISLLS